MQFMVTFRACFAFVKTKALFPAPSCLRPGFNFSNLAKRGTGVELDFLRPQSSKGLPDLFAAGNASARPMANKISLMRGIFAGRIPISSRLFMPSSSILSRPLQVKMYSALSGHSRFFSRRTSFFCAKRLLPGGKSEHDIEFSKCAPNDFARNSRNLPGKLSKIGTQVFFNFNGHFQCSCFCGKTACAPDPRYGVYSLFASVLGADNRW